MRYIIIFCVVITVVVLQLFIPNDFEKALVANEALASWQPEKDSFLGRLNRASAEFNLGFGTPADKVAAGHQVKTPYSLFRFADRSKFGFDLEPGEAATQSLTLFAGSHITVSVNQPNFYLNQQLVKSKLSEWSFPDKLTNLRLRANDSKSVKGVLTVDKGNYDYRGPAGLGLYNLKLPPWSLKSTGYVAQKGNVVLISSDQLDQPLTFVIYNWNFGIQDIKDVTIQTQGFLFWQFDHEGVLLIQSLDQSLDINIVPQS